MKRVLQLEGLASSGNLLLQIALLLRQRKLDPESLFWTATPGGNLVKIQIVLQPYDHPQAGPLMEDCRAIADMAHVQRCEAKYAWTMKPATQPPFSSDEIPPTATY